MSANCGGADFSTAEAPNKMQDDTRFGDGACAIASWPKSYPFLPRCKENRRVLPAKIGWKLAPERLHAVIARKKSPAPRCKPLALVLGLGVYTNTLNLRWFEVYVLEAQGIRHDLFLR